MADCDQPGRLAIRGTAISASAQLVITLSWLPKKKDMRLCGGGGLGRGGGGAHWVTDRRFLQSMLGEPEEDSASSDLREA